jgi:hypothetical protein
MGGGSEPDEWEEALREREAASGVMLSGATPTSIRVKLGRGLEG